MNSDALPHFNWDKNEIRKYAESLSLGDRCAYYLGLSKKLKKLDKPDLLLQLRGVEGLSMDGRELLNWLETLYDISYRQCNNQEIITQRDKPLNVSTVNDTAHTGPTELFTKFPLFDFSEFKLCLEKIDIHKLFHELQKRGFLKIEQKYIDDIFSPVTNEPLTIESKAKI